MNSVASIYRWQEYSFQYITAERKRYCPHTSLKVTFLAGWTNSKAGDENSHNDIGFESENGNASRVVVDKPLISGVFDRRDKKLSGSFTLNGDNPDAIDGLLSLTLGLLCEEQGDVLLHSSGVITDEGAFLFLGPGGAGKTTIAVELNGGRTPLSVDRTLVAFEEDGTAIAHSTPFGDRNKDLPGPASAPIKGIFFIEQATGHEVLPVDPFEATRLILAQTIAPTRTKETVQRVMDAVGRLVDGVPCHRLRFRKDDGFWPLIDEVLAK